MDAVCSEVSNMSASVVASQQHLNADKDSWRFGNNVMNMVQGFIGHFSRLSPCLLDTNFCIIHCFVCPEATALFGAVSAAGCMAFKLATVQ